MDEYIKKSDAVSCVPSRGTCVAWEIASDILSIPAADVRPVVYGKWVYDRETTAHDGWTYRQYHCNQCGGQVIGGPYDYCHFCGADMRPRRAEEQPPELTEKEEAK